MVKGAVRLTRADQRLYLPWARLANRHPKLSQAVKVGVPTAVAALAALADRAASFWTNTPESLAVSVPVASYLAHRARLAVSNRIELAQRREELEQSQSRDITLNIKGQSVLQRYILLGEVGEGGQATVIRAVNLSQGNRLEVLKIAFSQYAKDKDYRSRFFGEAELLANLDPSQHPGVVRVYGHGEMKGVPFYAMENIDGTSLEELIEKTSFSMLAATRMMLGIAERFQGIHAEGIIHRDIKPDNVLLTRGGDIKVIDFGIARDTRIVHKLTQTGTVFGTPEFMAYEQHLGQGIDHRTDIYAEGALFFNLLTGRVPFPLVKDEAYGSYVQRVMPMMQENHVPEIKDHLPNIDVKKLRPVLEHLQNIFRKLLISNMDYRYEDNSLFIQDLNVLEELLVQHGERG